MLTDKAAQGQAKSQSKFQQRLARMARKKHIDENVLRKHRINSTPEQFIFKVLMLSIILAIAIAVFMFILFYIRGFALPISALVSLVIGFVVQTIFYNMMTNFPATKGKKSARNAERDMIFAARDIIISLRSGSPLFNAIVYVSNGYGDASEEFRRIVEKVQVGVPLVDAIDRTIEESKVPSFKKIMLQAAVAIKSGSEVTTALSSIIQQIEEERYIQLKAYAQKLNVLSMFYMLFGVIFPSMGLALAIILTTFISIITINATILEVVIVFVIAVQVVFLQMLRTSRPAFTT
ncbi:MAG: archaeal flagellar protein FlaJ [Candidatus Micrarchaeota archaeon]|nr:MAG: archaeal flagellar protein FlaJ [Candidatus Micrarchaeota archaeon]